MNNYLEDEKLLNKLIKENESKSDELSGKLKSFFEKFKKSLKP